MGLMPFMNEPGLNFRILGRPHACAQPWPPCGRD